MGISRIEISDQRRDRLKWSVLKLALTGCIFLLIIGCTGVRQAPRPSTDMPPQQPVPITPETEPTETPLPEPAPPPPETTEAPPERPSPRALASLELSNQARILIEERKFDEAIQTLERAVNLHPGSGESYYYLAEAWRLKGDANQAAEYNTLASIRFKDDPGWMRRIEVQKQRIDRMK